MNHKEQKITLEEIRVAMDMIEKNEWHCPNCGTKRDFIVLGITGIDVVPQFCKCEAEKLSKTPFVQNQLKLVKEELK